MPTFPFYSVTFRDFAHASLQTDAMLFINGHVIRNLLIADP
jgi:hypothetical protein